MMGAKTDMAAFTSGPQELQDTEIYGNTVYNNVSSAVRFHVTSGISGVKIRNNIFVTDNNNLLVQGNPSTAVAKFENNSYWASGGTFSVAGYSSLNDWQNNESQEKYNANFVGFATNPQVKNAGGGQTIGNTDFLDTLTAYQLQINSPLLDKGLDLQAEFGINPGNVDFYGNYLPQHSQLDLGVHEYAGPWPEINADASFQLDGENGSTQTFDVTSNVAWQINETIPWLDVSPDSDSANASITATATSENNTGVSRHGTIFVSPTGGSLAEEDTVLVTQSPASYKIDFFAHEGANPVSGVEVTFNSQTQTTGGGGNTVFTNVLPGTEMGYLVTKSGYEDLSGSIDVTGDDSVFLEMIPVTYDVTFSITDGADPVEGVSVDFNSETLSTNSGGQVVFTGVEPGTNLPWLATKTGYTAENGTVTVNSDETVNVTMNLITYTVIFDVNDGTDPVSGANVTFNGESKSTNGSGQAEFTGVAPANDLSYSITKSGFYNETGSLDIAGDHTETISLTPVPAGTYEVTFNVDDGTTPVENAEVTFDSITLSTNQTGKAVFTGVEVGNNCPYTVSGSIYDTVNGTVNVVDQNISENVTLTQIKFAVTFDISDGSGSVDGAMVTFNSETKPTSISGNVVFNEVSQGTDLSWEITKTGYHSKNGTVDIFQDSTITVTLVEEASLVNLFFSITAGTNPLEGATVMLDDDSRTTNVNGDTVFSSVMPDNLYAYLVTKPGYDTAAGNVKISHDSTINIELSRAMFNLTVINGGSSGTYLYKDTITINANIAVQGTSFAYWARDNEYLDDSLSQTTTVIMPAKDITIEARYATGINQNKQVNIKIYPNPAGNYINIESETTGLVEIYTITGQKALEFEIDHNHALDVSGLESGLYIVKFSNRNVSEKMKLIKN
jgi:hypothetical protein